jgi:endo-1,4-beta-xylanase
VRFSLVFTLFLTVLLLAAQLRGDASTMPASVSSPGAQAPMQPTSVTSQTIEAPWQAAAQKQIDRLRKVEMALLVLDAKGQPVPGAAVSVKMSRHAFAWGVGLDRASLEKQPAVGRDEAVWRCFNTLSPTAAGQWTSVEPKPNARQFADMRALAGLARGSNLSLRWGTLIPTDTGRWPAFTAELQSQTLRTSMIELARAVLWESSISTESIDLLTYCVPRPGAAKSFSAAEVRQLYESVRVINPRVTLGVGFEDAFTGERPATVVTTLDSLLRAQVHPDVVTLECRLTGNVTERALRQTVNAVTDLSFPVFISGLEVGGWTPQAAAQGLDTALSVFFSTPGVVGVSLAGVRSTGLSDPTAALLDESNRPTPAGQTLENLLRQRWWTEMNVVSDELGQVRERVFAGWHKIVATLPDGSRAEVEVYIAPTAWGATEVPRAVVVQPLN